MAGRRPIDPELLLQHAGFVRAAARAAIGRDEAVEDAVQDTFAIALENAPRRPGALRSWLASIARHRALDLVRRRSRAHKRERAAARPEAEPSAQSVAQRAETGRILIDAVLALPESCRDAILLRYYDGLPPRRIGEELGISAEAARSRVKRGLRQLRETLDERHGGDRRKWALLLAPLIARAGASAATLVLGATLMKKAIGIAAVLVAGIAIWQLGAQMRSDPAPVRTTRTATTANGREDLSPAATAAQGPREIEGVVRRNEAPTAARVEARLVRAAAAADAWHYDGRDAVLAVPSRNRPVRAVRSGDDGTFRLEGLPEGRYELRAVADDLAWGFTTMGAFRNAPVEITIHGGAHALRGRIVHADQSAFEGHVLLAREYESVKLPGIRALACAETGADGRFTIGGLAPGPYFLSAVAPGRARVVRRVEAPGDVEIVVDANLRTVRGRVLADGTPVAGASVVTSYGSDDFVRLEHATRTDPDGAFSLPAARGQAQVHVRKPGYERAFLRLANGDDADLTIELEPLATYSGLVRRADGHEPVAGAPVYAVGMTERGYLEYGFSSVRTDDEGRFRIAAPRGAAVFVFGDGWASQGLGSWLVPGANPFVAGEEVILDVVPAARVAGVVKDPDGAPLAGVTVSAEFSRPTAPSFHALSSLWSGSPLGAGRTVRTGGDGRLSIADLCPGASYVVSAGHPRAESAPFQVASGATREIELRLPESRWAELFVTDEETGEPVAGARAQLIVRINGRSTRSENRHWTTADDGRARVGPLAPGSYALSIRAEGYVPNRSPNDTAFDVDAPGVAEVNVALRRGLRLAGRVEAPDGVPVAGVRVRAATHDRIEGLGPLAWTHAPYGTWCDREGAFAIDGVGPGRYVVRAEFRRGGKRLAAQAGADSGDESVVLQLADVTEELPESGLLVRVRDPEGNPVHQAILCMPGFMVGFAGRPFVVPMRERSTSLLVADAKDMAGRRMPVGSALVAPIDPGRRVIEVTLPPERRIRGRVIGEDGTGLAGVEVIAVPLHELLPKPTEIHRRHETRAVSGEDGTFELRYLGDFEYELHATGPGHWRPVHARAGSDGVRIGAEAVARSRIRIRDWQGKPLAGARVRYRVRPGSEGKSGQPPARPRALARYVSRWWDERLRAPLTADADGIVDIPGLEPDGEYELFVEGPSDRHDLQPDFRWKWVPADSTTIDLARAWRIHGVVVDLEGEPVADARLVSVGDAPRRAATTDARGRFAFELLPGPELIVRVYLGAREPADAPVRPLRAGDEPVRVPFDAGAELRIRVEGWRESDRYTLASLTAESALFRKRPEAGGRLRFRGLDPDETYVLWMRLRDGRHVYREGLRPGKAEVAVRVGESREIRGRIRYRGEGTADQLSVQTRRGPVSAVAAVAEDGTFVLRGLPPGTYPVRALAYRKVDGERRFEHLGERTVDVEAGGSVTIDIRP